jgi:hypothetical protein
VIALAEAQVYARDQNFHYAMQSDEPLQKASRLTITTGLRVLISNPNCAVSLGASKFGLTFAVNSGACRRDAFGITETTRSRRFFSRLGDEPDKTGDPAPNDSHYSAAIADSAIATSTKVSEKVGARPRSAKADGLRAFTVAPVRLRLCQ